MRNTLVSREILSAKEGVHSTHKYTFLSVTLIVQSIDVTGNKIRYDLKETILSYRVACNTMDLPNYHIF